MLWNKPQPLRIPQAPKPVPDARALRISVLQSSWQRDRWVAGRRIALRWVVWYFKRYGLLAIAAIAAASAYWSRTVPPPAAPPPKAATETTVSATADSLLRLERSWGTPPLAGAAPSAPAGEDDFSVPPLYFDNALHSQEP